MRALVARENQKMEEKEKVIVSWMNLQSLTHILPTGEKDVSQILKMKYP